MFTDLQGVRESFNHVQVLMLYYPGKVDEEASLTDETKERDQNQPVIPSQALDHVASDKEAQTRAKDCDGHERNRDGGQSFSVVRPGPGLRRTLGISLPGYDMRFHCVCDSCERAECCIPPSQSISLVGLNQ